MGYYIEKSFPIGNLSLLAERESWRKEIYRPVYYLHKWWARRLGSVFRGIILGACIEQGADFFGEYYSRHNFRDIVVFDPFMGSGVTVGEASKLGCRAIGRDINHVASVIVKASLTQYDHQEVEDCFHAIERNTKDKIRSYYKTELMSGEIVDVLYYFLVKYLECPSCARNIELFKSRIFSKNAVPSKDSSARALCPRCSAINHTRYDCKNVTCTTCTHTYNPQPGTVKGAFVTCVWCGEKFRLVDFLQDIEGPLEHRIYAKMVLHADGTKTYEPVTHFDKKLEQQAQADYESIRDTLPDVLIREGYNTNQILKYNYKSWHQMFTKRQLVCISILADEIRKINHPDLKRLFACLLSGVLEFTNCFSSFKGEGTGAVRHMFAHHILRPELMPIDANIWGTPKSSGSFSTLYQRRVLQALSYKSNPFELKLNGKTATKVSNVNSPLELQVCDTYQEFRLNGNAVYISQGDSSRTDIDDESVSLIVTDPPFFDNVHYSQLADFFYYWLNTILDLSGDGTTRNEAEVQDTDPANFSRKLSEVFSECYRVLKSNGLLIFTYHHSRHEGWVAVHSAIRHAGFRCVQSYPIKAEMSVAMSIQQAKTPIHLDLILICRKDQQREIEQVSDILHAAVDTAGSQILELTSAGINVSLGDAKVAVMGRLLCELSHIGNLVQELELLQDIEEQVDSFLVGLLDSGSKAIYEPEREPEQLMLFEKMEEYFARDGVFNRNEHFITPSKLR